MMKKIPMTKAGYEKLRSEHERLVKAERPKNIQAIAEARAHGDLSENAEYHAAKERQSFIEGRIQEIQAKMAHAQVIDIGSIQHKKVVFGATVDLEDGESGEERSYTLVGVDEVDVKRGRISVESPIGRALIGHEVGDVVTIRTPARTVDYEILSIRFDEIE